MKTRTALSDFICNLEDGGQLFDKDFKDEFLEKEKQQIIDSVNSQRQMGWDEKGEQYYNETFKND